MTSRQDGLQDAVDVESWENIAVLQKDDLFNTVQAWVDTVDTIDLIPEEATLKAFVLADPIIIATPSTHPCSLVT